MSLPNAHADAGGGVAPIELRCTQLGNDL